VALNSFLMSIRRLYQLGFWPSVTGPRTYQRANRSAHVGSRCNDQSRSCRLKCFPIKSSAPQQCRQPAALSFVSLWATCKYSNANDLPVPFGQANTPRTNLSRDGVNTKGFIAILECFANFEFALLEDQRYRFFNCQSSFAYECFACGAGAFSRVLPSYLTSSHGAGEPK